MRQQGDVMIVDKVAYMPVRGRKVPFARSRGKDIFFNLGGKRATKPDGTAESDLEALVREVREEAGVELVAETVKLLRKFTGPCHGYPAGTQLRMVVYTGEHRGELAPSAEVEEIAWFTSVDAHRTTEMGQQILRWFKEQGLID
jgi:8-oxo-dGTP diphosphatase